MNASQPAGKPLPNCLPSNDLKLQFLTRDQVLRIDELLVTVGDCGEIHLIVQRGELRLY